MVTTIARPRQEITRFRNPRTPQLPSNARNKVKARRIAQIGICSTPGVTAALRPSLIYTMGLKRTAIFSQIIFFNPAHG